MVFVFNKETEPPYEAHTSQKVKWAKDENSCS